MRIARVFDFQKIKKRQVELNFIEREGLTAGLQGDTTFALRFFGEC